MNANRNTNPTLQAWLDEYRAIADEYLDAIRETGVVFGEPYAWQPATEELLSRLREKGAFLRNGCASIVSGPISEACIACSSSLDDKTFLFSVKCHRNCYFCFNPNQDDYELRLHEDADWRTEMNELAQSGRTMTHIALTGGEPLLRPDETIAFFSEARRLWPQVHTRLYTTGDQLSEPLLEALVEAGMNEIRFSVKPDDAPAEHERTMNNLRMASTYAAVLREQHDACKNEAGKNNDTALAATADAIEPSAADLARLSSTYAGNLSAGQSITDPQHRTRTLDVMVEMPVLPDSFDEMRILLDELEDMGAFGINLLEFCYPFNNWHEFAVRGFTIKNPPYPVMYDYDYAGSLPIEGSEEVCLRLIEYALDAGMNLGVHYCSLENKHRSQVHGQNHSTKINHPCYKMDADDFFYKTVKVFGRDVPPVRAFLERSITGPALVLGGRSWDYDEEDDCLSFHPRHLKAVIAADLRSKGGLAVEPVTSVNILEWHNGSAVLRELALLPA